MPGGRFDDVSEGPTENWHGAVSEGPSADSVLSARGEGGDS